jgi:hypothetical protein
VNVQRTGIGVGVGSLKRHLDFPKNVPLLFTVAEKRD